MLFLLKIVIDSFGEAVTLIFLTGNRLLAKIAENDTPFLRTPSPFWFKRNCGISVTLQNRLNVPMTCAALFHPENLKDCLVQFVLLQSVSLRPAGQLHGLTSSLTFVAHLH